MITMQGGRQLLGTHYANDPLAVLHLADMALRDSSGLGKLHLSHPFPVPVAGQERAGLITLELGESITPVGAIIGLLQTDLGGIIAELLELLGWSDKTGRISTGLSYVAICQEFSENVS